MKAKDLMIGDWVLHNGKPIQVYNVFSSSINETYYGISNEVADYIPESEIEPIPLTPEILEKNGFKSINNGNNNIYYKLGFNEYKNEVFWLSGSIIIDYDGDDAYLCDAKYVHELQHILKLCKIEKEIIV